MVPAGAEALSNDGPAMTFELTDAAVSPAGSAAAAPSTPHRLARARTATRVQFALLGIVGGAWGVHIPSVKAHFGLGEAMLSTVLLAVAVGALLCLLAAGRVIGRLGARRTAAGSAAVLSLQLALALQWPSLPMLLGAMLVFGAAMSLFDIAINTEGTVLESLGGRAVMSNLHAMFSVGAMAGAALAGVMLRAGVPPAAQLAAIGIAVGLGAALAAGSMLETHPPAPGGDGAVHFAWPRGMLLLIGLLIFAGMSAEGVMYDWSVLYLKQEVGMAQDAAAMGYVAFAGAMALSRFAGDALRMRLGERLLLRAGGGLTAASMAVLLLSGDPVVSVAGYALIGAGLAPVVPILFNAAARVPGTSRAAAIAAVSSIGYAGFLIGPPLIGGIAHVASLTAAMTVVVVAALLLVVGARRVA
jgi:fucose permease